MTDTNTEGTGSALRVKPKLVKLDDGREIFSVGDGMIESTGRQPAALLTLDNGRKITSTGKWNDGLLLGYLMEAEAEYQMRVERAANAENARERFNRGWVEVGELAKIAYGQNALDSKKKVRARLSTLWQFALLHNVILVLDYASGAAHGRIVAAKVFDHTDDTEVKKLDAMLTKRLKTGELNSELYDKARALVREDVEAAAAEVAA